MFTASSMSFSSVTAFDFNNAYITAAYDDTETVTVIGLLLDDIIYSSTITTYKITDLDNPQPYWFNFNFTGVDTVRFIPHGMQIVVLTTLP